ncbi:MAG TPA: prolipoprotein diacylglyceryl transferase family protein [Oceanobacillus sp.]|nr:prolipoprotein diacylglyceryl transferase family protein [Oceanobacillus sp.]
MFTEIVIGPYTLRTFSLALALAIAAALGLAALRRGWRFGDLVDVWLTGFAGGIVGARLFHVLLQWTYFSDNLGEALRLNAGGLDWHGAVFGGLVGLWIGSRWRKLPFRALLDALTPALPLLALAGWIGCYAVACGYGAEVDTLANYSPIVASEIRDIYGILAPRYNTQIFGMGLALVLMLSTAVLFWRKWLYYRRFWLVLGLLSVGMLVIGFYRGDEVLSIDGVRGDQILDGVIAGYSFILAIKPFHHPVTLP